MVKRMRSWRDEEKKASKRPFVRKLSLLKEGFLVTGCACLLLFGLLGCATTTEEEVGESIALLPVETEEAATTASNSTRTSIESDASVMDSYDWTFSDRDFDSSYDESAATKISLSDSDSSFEGSGVAIEGSAVAITEAGTYVVGGSLSDGSITVDVPGENDKVQLVLAGVDIACNNGPAILVENADKVFITLAAGSQNTLSDGATHDLAADENDHDGVIFSHDDLTLNGTGTLIVEANYDNGIVGKNDVRITEGTYFVDAVGHGVQGKDCIKIIDGDFTITSGADAFHASNDEDDMLGYLGVGGGVFSITAGDDAFHAEGALLIADGTIAILESYEGYEGRTVSITGGTSTVVSSDDGVNAATGSNLGDDQGFMGPGAQGGAQQPGMPEQGQAPRGTTTQTVGYAAGEPETTQLATSTENIEDTTTQASQSSSDCFFEMTGGYLYVKAGGDGLDSNGSFTISGGDVVVECVATGGNGAIDCDSGAIVTGGTVVAIGPSDMAQGFGGSSTQASIMVSNQTLDSSGKTLEVVDADGNVIYSVDLTTSNSSLIVSCPEMIEDQNYTVVVDGQEVANATAALVNQGFGMGGGQGGPGGMGGEQGGPGGMGGR